MSYAQLLKSHKFNESGVTLLPCNRWTNAEALNKVQEGKNRGRCCRDRRHTD